MAYAGIGAGAALIVGGIAFFLFSGGSSTSESGRQIAQIQPSEPSVAASADPASNAGYAPRIALKPEASTGQSASSGSVSTTSSGSPDLSSATALTSTNSVQSVGTNVSRSATSSEGSTATDSSTSNEGDPAAALTGEPRRSEPFPSLADLIEYVEPSVVRVNVYSKEGRGNGSGYIVDRDGTLVTNRHVIEGASRVTGVFAGDKTEYPITGLYSIDEKKDIAILKIECPAEKLKPLLIATDTPRKGEDLVAFGAPLGLDFTASEGILSATRDAEDLAKMGLSGHEGVWMQHTVPISPGNSGGPLVNMKGELIGMNTMQFTIGQNLNFAISAVDVADALLKKSSVKPLQSDSVPVLARHDDDEDDVPKFQVVDIVGTEKAKEFLGKLDRMQIIMLALGFDPTRRVTATVRSDLEESIEKADVKPSSRSEARMFVGMRLRSAAGVAGTQSVSIMTMVHYLDISGERPTVYLIWNEEETVGTVAGQAFLQGVVPARLRSGIKSHFRKFMGAVNKSRREQEEKS